MNAHTRQTPRNNPDRQRQGAGGHFAYIPYTSWFANHAITATYTLIPRLGSLAYAAADAGICNVPPAYHHSQKIQQAPPIDFSSSELYDLENTLVLARGLMPGRHDSAERKRSREEPNNIVAVGP
jgi:hypothetical protein